MSPVKLRATQQMTSSTVFAKVLPAVGFVWYRYRYQHGAAAGYQHMALTDTAIRTTKRPAQPLELSDRGGVLARIVIYLRFLAVIGFCGFAYEVGLPVAIAAVVRLLVEIGVPLPRIDRMEVTGPVIFGLMMWAFFIQFSVPILGVFYGTNAFVGQSALYVDDAHVRNGSLLEGEAIERDEVLIGTLAGDRESCGR